METFQWLTDEDAAKAEAMILPQLTGITGKTYGQIMNLAARIANEVDPGLAERRRKAATKHASRVQMYREQSGAAALSGRDLPVDETLAAYANTTARAAEYKDSGAFPDARMDQLCATAYLDLINGVTADTRIALGYLRPDYLYPEAAPVHRGRHGSRRTTRTTETRTMDTRGAPTRWPSLRAEMALVAAVLGAATSRSGHHREPPGLDDLVFPLATLLGLADRPGEGHGLGVLDPDLCRDLAAIAAASRTPRYASRSRTRMASLLAMAAGGHGSKLAHAGSTPPERHHLPWPCPPG